MKAPPQRAATVDDIEAVLALLRHAQCELPMGRWDDDRARARIADCVTHGAVVLSLSHGNPVGTVGLRPEQLDWSNDYVLSGRWVFVHPAHRRAPHAASLLRTATNIAKGAGMPLHMGIFSTVRTSGKVRLFQREFGAPIGATFLTGND